MALRVCFFEDHKFHQFYPLTYLRPVYLLRAGIIPLFRRVEREFKDVEISLLTRDQIGPLVADQVRDYPVNIIKRDENQEVLFINGRIRDYGNLPDQVRQSRLSTIFKSGDQTAAVLFKLDSLQRVPRITTPDTYHQIMAGEGKDIPDFPTTATLYNYCWEIMHDIESEINRDFHHLAAGFSGRPQATVHDGAYLVKKDAIRLCSDVEIMPGSVIDASRGAVYIDTNTKVEAHAAIYGPCYIGPNSLVVAGKISGCSIGHTCRVGGEVEESVFQSYVNKYHAGFIGHSYIGSWVNFGAMTTNSDLKNNYSTIRVTVNGQSVDSGSIKVGSFIGDHTKFGIGTLLNTGITIGVCCNIFGGNLVADKEVLSFSWGSTGQYEPYKIDKALETANRTTERRNVQLSEHERKVLESVYARQADNSGVITW